MKDQSAQIRASSTGLESPKADPGPRESPKAVEMSSKRPEHTGPPELFYDSSEARKYTENSRMVAIQAAMSERAIELLGLDEDAPPSLLLDIGCGSGLSGDAITEAGHFWVGYDISPDMLEIAVEREVEGGLVLADAGQGLQFRAGSFDGAVSISALQWLCQSDSRAQSVPRRLRRLFTSLYAALGRGGRAVFQWYPENSAQVELVTQQAMKSGFTGGLVVDYPNSAKAKKVFLVLSAGGSVRSVPRGLDDGAEGVSFAGRARGSAKGKPPKNSKTWIQARKDRDRRKGREVRADSKYTGRRRKAL